MIPAETVVRARDASILETAFLCGASARSLRKVGGEWNGPCPACGGRDRFWVDEAKNVFLCRMSGAAGDPIELVRHRHQCSFGEAVEMLTGARSMPAPQPRTAPARGDDNIYREKARRRAWAIWKSGRPVEISSSGHLVMRYLAIRGIPVPDWHIGALREIDQLGYWHWSKEKRQEVLIYKGPAMLAAITGPDGRFIGVHRTWLDLSRSNGKAVIADPETGEVLDAKKVMGSQRGGKIVLRKGEPGGACVMGEGIETTLSWHFLDRPLSVFDGSAFPRAALWCGVNLDNIAGKAACQIPHPSLTSRDALGRERKVKVGGHEPDLSDTGSLRVPSGDFCKLILLGDGDSDRYSTQAAMLRARKRHQAAGLPVEIDWAGEGQDFNDMLRAAGERRPAREVA